MYLYFEPGTSLRLYLGGKFIDDLDFWSVPVDRQITNVKSFEALLEKLGYPNLYIGLMPNGEVSGYESAERKKFIEEIENYDAAPWLERALHYGNARFLIVREPAK